MLTLLRRQYRRLAMFCTGMSLFATLLLIAGGRDYENGQIIIFFFISLLVSLWMAAALFLLRPGQRGMLEIAGLAALISAAVLFYLPGDGIVPLVSGVAIFHGISTTIWFLLQSEFGRRLKFATTWRDRHSGEVDYPAKLVWRHIVPGACEPRENCTGMIDSYHWDEDDKDTLHLHFKPRSSGKTASYSVTFLEQEKPNYCRFYFEGREADGTIVDGIFVLRMATITEGSCYLSALEERSGLSLGSLTERWFDNALSFQYDRLLETLDRLYGDGAGITKPLEQPAE